MKKMRKLIKLVLIFASANILVMIIGMIDQYVLLNVKRSILNQNCRGGGKPYAMTGSWNETHSFNWSDNVCDRRLFFVLCFLITLSACSDSIEREAGVSKVDWLPDSAGDISFWISGETRYYDFHISEKEFDKWILSRGYELGLDPSTGFPYTDDYVKSYHYYDHNADKLSRFNVEGEGYVWIQNRGEDGGGYTVVYDREKQRAYFAASTH